MELQVHVRLAGPGGRPPAGTPVRIEVRDVSLQDVVAVVVASADAEVTESAAQDDDAALAVATLDVPDEAFAGGRDVVLWARVAASGQERVAAGDLLTTQSQPLRAPTAEARGWSAGGEVGAAPAADVEVTRIG